MDKQILEVLKEIREILKENQALVKQSAQRQKKVFQRIYIFLAIIAALTIFSLVHFR